MAKAKSKPVEDVEEVQDLGKPDFAQLLDDDEPTLIDAATRDDEKDVENDDDIAGMAAGELVGIGIMLLTDYLAERRGDHWTVSTKELKKLAKAVDGSIPETELSPAWALAAVGIGVFAPRVVADIHINKQKVIESEVETKAS